MDPATRSQLERIEAALLRDIETAGEGPASMRRSKFVSEMEKKSFVLAHGQKAYDDLED